MTEKRPRTQVGEPVVDGGPVVSASSPYLCADCGWWDADGGGAVPPITGLWYCREHLGRAIKRDYPRARRKVRP